MDRLLDQRAPESSEMMQAIMNELVEQRRAIERLENTIKELAKRLDQK